MKKELVESKHENEIIVISDIYGWNAIPFAEGKNAIYLDARELASLDFEDNIHEQFISGGIDRAAEYLASYQAKTVIGLSVGGVIAWRAVLKGMIVDKFIGISATRLRFEQVKPNCKIALFYGQDDEFKPSSKWFKTHNLDYTLIPNKGHDIYKDPMLLKL